MISENEIEWEIGRNRKFYSSKIKTYFLDD